MKLDPAYIGLVQDVSGASVKIELSNETITGVSFVEGECYRIGQVGSFVKIPVGFTDLFGLVSQVGAGAAPAGDENRQPYGNRWLQIQLVGERMRGGQFLRGISQYPTIEDKAFIVTEKDMQAIYSLLDLKNYVSIGNLASAETIPAYVDINKIVTRHTAVVGSTGCGKSTTVAAFLNSISDKTKFPSARILILDIHGEYGRALGDKANIFKINANNEMNEKELQIPFWALNFEELLNFSFGGLDDSKHAVISEKVMRLKRESLKNQPINGINPDKITVDTPVPFCLHQLWFELYEQDFMTIIPKSRERLDEVEIAYVNDDENGILVGNAMLVEPPVYYSVKTTGPPEDRIQWGRDPINIRQKILSLGSKLRDSRYDFICNPGNWKPDIHGKVKNNLESLIKGWIGNEKPISILDLSGVPSVISNDIIGALLRILYDALLWGKDLREGGRERPLFLILEEAHTYLGTSSSGSAASAVKRIAKEGRKYGVGLMVVSQRPSEIDPTILSQCGTTVAMRLTNNLDRGHVAGAAADNLKGLFDMLPILRTGEAIIVGEAVSLPIRAVIKPPPSDKKPDSVDPIVVPNLLDNENPEGHEGWANDPGDEDYGLMIRRWRLQSTNPDGIIKGRAKDKLFYEPESSHILGFSYDPVEKELSVLFRNGICYDYYDVPNDVYASFKNAKSRGRFLNDNIRANFRYARQKTTATEPHKQKATVAEPD